MYSTQKQLEAILRQAGIAPVFANSRQLPTTPADVLEADMAIVGADHGDHRPVKGYSFFRRFRWSFPSRGRTLPRESPPFRRRMSAP
ncbi:MAG: hypothetical protein ACLR23_21140 [Clostridia bacterium]